MMTTMPKKTRRSLVLLMACLMLLMPLCAAAGTAIVPTEDMKAHGSGEAAIPETPTLLGALGEGEEPPVTEEPSSEPTATPTAEPTAPPSPAPAAEYEIQMSPPSGWYATRAVMEITIDDRGGTGWASVRITMERSSGTVVLIDGPLPSGHIWIDLLDNCVVEAVITDPNGGTHSNKATVACFDRENPSLTASVQGEYLSIEATDKQSGIAAVQVNGTTYTELTDGKLKIGLKQYADAYEQLIVQAVDKVGNVSKAIAVANPFYKNTGAPTAKPTATPKPTTPTKPTSTPKPANTPKPTKTPKPGAGGSGGSSGSGSSGTGSATATPIATFAPTPTPMAILLPTTVPTINPGFPFSMTGNSTTRDLLYDQYTNKQFIAIETRGGDVFYIVIDYDKPLDDKGERFETYFLNLVDSRDMLDITGETKTPEPEIIYVTPDPTEKPTPAPLVAEPEKQSGNGGGMLGLLGILAAAGGGAFWFIKIRKSSGRKSKASFDDYGDEDDEDDEPEENEDE